MRIGLTGWNILPMPAKLPTARPCRLLAVADPDAGHRRSDEIQKLWPVQRGSTADDASFMPHIQTDRGAQ